MDSDTLAGKLQQCSAEYASISGINIDVPGKLWAFLASRLTESELSIEDPWDVVQMTVDGVVRKVRITGHSNGQLSFSFADGSPGFGMGIISAVTENDNPKLADILDKLEGTFAGRASRAESHGDVIRLGLD